MDSRERVEAWASALGGSAVRCVGCGGWTVCGQGVEESRAKCSGCSRS